MSRSFAEIKHNQPQHGDILESLSGAPVKLAEESREENGVLKRGVLCRAVVSVDKDGWYLSDQGVGLVCLVLPDSQKKLARGEDNRLAVDRLRVVRYTKSGRALLCETVEG